MKRIFILMLLFVLSLSLSAQQPLKHGYNLGALPAVSYNTDEGFQYGAILNLFNYGDGSQYPKYDQSYYVELSKYTKGSSVLRFYFDSEHFIKGIRTFLDLSYISENMLDFYGFNGYKSTYSHSQEYGNRALYRFSQKQLRLITDLKGTLPLKNLYWTASLNLVNYDVEAVDYAKLNENPNFVDLTPGESLYEKYVSWGILDSKEAKGGLVSSIKAGIIYDTRPVLNNPSKGMYTEALLELAPSLTNKSPYARYSLIHRQYQSIVKDRLNAAMRIGLQGQIGHNQIPFYRSTVLISPFANRTSPTGIGGASSVRGLLRNRVVGNAIALANFELRWKALNFTFINQNFYLGVNGFFDSGYILDPRDWDLAALTPSEKSSYFNLHSSDGMHSTLGGGFKVVMNENFIVSVEMGKALNKNDGDKGMYINLNYLF